jgi:hypothetical protein
VKATEHLALEDLAEVDDLGCPVAEAHVKCLRAAGLDEHPDHDTEDPGEFWHIVPHCLVQAGSRRRPVPPRCTGRSSDSPG